MYNAMRLRCFLLHPPLWCKSSSLGISASCGGGSGCFVRGFSAVGAPRFEGRRRQRGGGGGEQRQEHARLSERDQQEWLSGERFFKDCKRRESPFLTRRERFHNEFLRRVVPWEKGNFTWQNFPYYVNENARQLLSECAAGIPPTAQRRHIRVWLPAAILWREDAAPELARERLVRALAHELRVPLLILDSSVLAPYDHVEDYSENKEEGEHAESEDEGSGSEIEDEGDEDWTSSNEAKSDESDEDDTLKSVEDLKKSADDLKKLVPCTIEEFAKGKHRQEEGRTASVLWDERLDYRLG